MLKKIVLDLSTRLPGPLACKNLGDLGFEVIKIEDINHPDTFKNTNAGENFLSWYEEINKNKKIISLDLKNTDEVKKYTDFADIIISSIPDKILNSLIDSDQKKTQTIIKIKSSRDNQPLHDLNILAQSGLLKLHDLNHPNTIPFIPIAGTTFAQHIAQEALASYIESQELKTLISKEVYLEDAVNKNLSFLWPNHDRDSNSHKYLHNGKYLCYNVYELNDGKKVALAAIEEKFWNQFLNIFKLPKNLNALSTNINDKKIIEEKLKNFSSDAVLRLIEKNNICLTVY